MDRAFILDRLFERGSSTVGLLTDPKGNEWFTMERGWANNARFQSCIPPGTYTLNETDHPTFGKTWYITGQGCTLVREPNSNRWAIFIHTANFAQELIGCIAPGSGMTWAEGVPMITSSRHAMEDIREKWWGKNIIKTLIIK